MALNVQPVAAILGRDRFVPKFWPHFRLLQVNVVTFGRMIHQH
jgi:hypothetical protein